MWLEILSGWFDQGNNTEFKWDESSVLEAKENPELRLSHGGCKFLFTNDDIHVLFEK